MINDCLNFKLKMSMYGFFIINYWKVIIVKEVSVGEVVIEDV